MMALNIAVPLTSVGDLMDGFGLLSPISPLSVDCRGVTAAGSHGKKQLVSPVGSESSGVSSLDSEDIKKPSSPPASPTEEVERPSSVGSPLPASGDNKSEAAETADGSTNQPSSDCPSSSSSSSSMRSSLSSTDSLSDEPGSNHEDSVDPAVPEKELKIVLSGRNVLDLIDNLTAPGHFRLQYAQLPENDNIHFFLDNRSQYHRLGANGHIQEYTMVNCRCCDFSYPVNGTSVANGIPAIGTTAMGSFNQAANLTSASFQHQQQQQQHQLQWNSFANGYNSIANSRDKMSVNVAANAFNKATGTYNGGNSNNGGNQYFRNGNIAAGLFGRDSNRNNGGNSFLNSTSTYNNHKSYQQQSFGVPNNSIGTKFNNPYGQLQQQQQQPFYSKNHSLRYGTGGNNGTGGGNQSTSSSLSGFNSSAAVVTAAALASQNILNFNNFNNSNNSYNNNNNKSNNNNMFAYYKTMM